ncbi:hypothetical protein WJX74_010908 [Apatococcus lobatus]|uniref:Uncharacterized protein n=1 Tax=Apatococcus lobatus TaxID=904363 RepID=A0AAW1QJB7_9CHLO
MAFLWGLDQANTSLVCHFQNHPDFRLVLTTIPEGDDARSGFPGIHLIGYEVAAGLMQLQSELDANRELLVVFNLGGTLIDYSDQRQLEADLHALQKSYVKSMKRQFGQEWMDADVSVRFADLPGFNFKSFTARPKMEGEVAIISRAVPDDPNSSIILHPRPGVDKVLRTLSADAEDVSSNPLCPNKFRTVICTKDPRAPAELAWVWLDPRADIILQDLMPVRIAADQEHPKTLATILQMHNQQASVNPGPQAQHSLIPNALIVDHDDKELQSLVMEIAEQPVNMKQELQAFGKLDQLSHFFQVRYDFLERALPAPGYIAALHHLPATELLHNEATPGDTIIAPPVESPEKPLLKHDDELDILHGLFNALPTTPAQPQQHGLPMPQPASINLAQ